MPVAESLLEPGETLRGCCVATQSSLFKGRMVVIAVSDDRIVVQGMTRKFEREGEPIVLTAERIASASAAGAGDGWVEIGAAIMDRAALTLRLATTDGEKLKLMMMRGTGPLGKLGGGEVQREGVVALGEWFGRHAND